MKRYVVAIGLWVFVIQVPVAQDAAHPELENALAEAVEKWKLCPFTVEVRTYDAEGNEIGKKLEAEESKAGQMLSLPLVFRRGRFDLFPLPPVPQKDGKEARVIEFVPRPEKLRLKPKAGENTDLNKTLNRLRGTVFLDRNPTSIIRIDGNLHEEVGYSRWYLLGVPIFWVKDLKFTYQQEWNIYKWVPSRTDGGYQYRRKGGDFKRKEFHLVFSCGTL